MNWKLIFQLSLFGLVMGIATVFVIPSKIEPLFWVCIFVFCAWVIAKRTQKHFLHGLFLGLVNSIWITGAHMIFVDQYGATHAQEMSAMSAMPMSPRAMMAMTGPLVGIISGAVIGVLALIVGKVTRRTEAVPNSSL